MVYIVASVAVVFFIAALMYFKYFSLSKKNYNLEQSAGSSSFVQCPVCSSCLLKGQKLFSKVFRPSKSANDQLCYIYGCSNCYPVCSKEIKRSCPVCKKTLPQDGFLLARMFNKTKSGKPHVIINGCGNCGKKN